jgi:hypothetical protein
MVVMMRGIRAALAAVGEEQGTARTVLQTHRARRLASFLERVQQRSNKRGRVDVQRKKGKRDSATAPKIFER